MKNAVPVIYKYPGAHRGKTRISAEEQRREQAEKHPHCKKAGSKARHRDEQRKTLPPLSIFSYALGSAFKRTSAAGKALLPHVC